MLVCVFTCGEALRQFGGLHAGFLMFCVSTIAESRAKIWSVKYICSTDIRYGAVIIDLNLLFLPQCDEIFWSGPHFVK